MDSSFLYYYTENYKDVTMILICPICRGALEEKENGLECNNNHRFDYAKEGYINLHIGKNSKNPGDDKTMVNSRREFLNKGFYENISNKLNEILRQELDGHNRILDIGAGEGYYTNRMKQEFLDADVYAIDVSKEAMKKSSKSYKNIKWFVTSGSNQPFSDNSFDVVTVLFSKLFSNEYRRVLKKDGILLVISPNKDHLVDIKRVVYPMIKYESMDPYDELKDQFILEKRINLKYKKMIYGIDIMNLFHMTPYRWKSPIDGVKRLEELKELEVTVDVNIDIYKMK